MIYDDIPSKPYDSMCKETVENEKHDQDDFWKYANAGCFTENEKFWMLVETDLKVGRCTWND